MAQLTKTYKNFVNGIAIDPKSVSQNALLGDVEVLSGDNKIHFHNGTINDPLVSEAAAATLTNKTLSGNTATNLINGSGVFDFNSSGIITTPNATDTLVAKNTTDILTNKTIDANNNTISNVINANLSGSAAISNSNLAAMTDQTIKGNNSGGSSIPLDLTVAQVNTMLGTTGSATSIGSLDSQAANAQGLALAGHILSTQSADATHPGVVNNTAQTLSGVKTFSSAPNLSSLTASLPLQLDSSKNITAALITNSGLATMGAHTVKSNNTGSTAAPTDVALGTTTESTSSILTLSNWANATVGSPTIEVKQSSGSQSGYLSSTDWSTFNSKQASGNYITALTGDVAASGPGSVAATLATVNSNVGTFNNSTITVDAKGRITAASTGSSGVTNSCRYTGSTTTLSGATTVVFPTQTFSNSLTVNTSTGICTINNTGTYIVCGMLITGNTSGVNAMTASIQQTGSVSATTLVGEASKQASTGQPKCITFSIIMNCVASDTLRIIGNDGDANALASTSYVSITQV